MDFRCLLLLVTFLQVVVSLQDCLIKSTDIQTTLDKGDNQIALTNGLITRNFSLTPGFTTIDFFCHYKNQSLLRSLSPEAEIQLDDIHYSVGALKSSLHNAYLDRSLLDKTLRSDEQAFQYVSYSVSKALHTYSQRIKAYGSHTFLSKEDWYPPGLHLTVLFRAPKTAPESHKLVKVKVHYEMYDSIPVMSKWLEVDGSHSEVNVRVDYVERMNVNRQWGSDPYEWVSMRQDAEYNPFSRPWLHLETTDPVLSSVSWRMETPHPAGAYTPQVTAQYNTLIQVYLKKDTFISFRTLLLVTGSSDEERQALSQQKMSSVIAPQTKQRPLTFHSSSSRLSHILPLLDQMFDARLELLVLDVDIFNTTSSYQQDLVQIVRYAKQKYIEVGIALSLTKYKNLKDEWKRISAETYERENEACMASAWFDYLSNRLKKFISLTEVSMIHVYPHDTELCAAFDHAYHSSIPDSLMEQNNKVNQFYEALKANGIYIQSSDWSIYHGTNSLCE